MLKGGGPHGDGGRADGGTGPAAHDPLDTNPDDRAMRLQELKHKVEADAYRVDPHDVAAALLLRVDPRRDLFTGLLSPRDARSREGCAGPSGRRA